MSLTIVHGCLSYCPWMSHYCPWMSLILSMDVSRHCTRTFLVILHGCLSLLSTDVSHTVHGCLFIIHGGFSSFSMDVSRYCPRMSLASVHGCLLILSMDVSRHCPRMFLILSMDVSSLSTDVSHTVNGSLSYCQWRTLMLFMDVSRHGRWKRAIRSHTQLKISVVRVGVQ